MVAVNPLGKDDRIAGEKHSEDHLRQHGRQCGKNVSSSWKASLPDYTKGKGHEKINARKTGVFNDNGNESVRLHRQALVRRRRRGAP
jgi:hypothetical protein